MSAWLNALAAGDEVIVSSNYGRVRDLGCVVKRDRVKIVVRVRGGEMAFNAGSGHQRGGGRFDGAHIDQIRGDGERETIIAESRRRIANERIRSAQARTFAGVSLEALEQAAELLDPSASSPESPTP